LQCDLVSSVFEQLLKRLRICIETATNALTLLNSNSTSEEEKLQCYDLYISAVHKTKLEHGTLQLMDTIVTTVKVNSKSEISMTASTLYTWYREFINNKYKGFNED